ncbi:enoyl-CoA hydratase/isomerase family protein [Mycobacterium xenopi 3993]|nr:enoyl-CoA hydratase/isomerase family protein [Mycobacterium xenopi 3993]
MSENTLQVDTSERIRTLTLNRPRSRNALSAVLRDRLFTALAQAEADDDVDVVILTGADPYFVRVLISKSWASSRRCPTSPRAGLL